MMTLYDFMLTTVYLYLGITFQIAGIEFQILYEATTVTSFLLALFTVSRY